LVASQERFELPTDGLEGRCSIQLSYWDKDNVYKFNCSTTSWLYVDVICDEHSQKVLIFRSHLSYLWM
jgi:hypothetical protein